MPCSKEGVGGRQREGARQREGGGGGKGEGGSQAKRGREGVGEGRGREPGKEREGGVGEGFGGREREGARQRGREGGVEGAWCTRLREKRVVILSPESSLARLLGSQCVSSGSVPLVKIPAMSWDRVRPAGGVPTCHRCGISTPSAHALWVSRRLHTASLIPRPL